MTLLFHANLKDFVVVHVTGCFEEVENGIVFLSAAARSLVCPGIWPELGKLGVVGAQVDLAQRRFLFQPNNKTRPDSS